MRNFTANIVVCSNIETMQGERSYEQAAEWLRNFTSHLLDSGIVNHKSDSTFRNWNGGKYAEQTKMYGFHTLGGGVVFTGADVREDDGTSSVYEWRELAPGEQKAVSEAISAAHAYADKTTPTPTA